MRNKKYYLNDNDSILEKFFEEESETEVRQTTNEKSSRSQKSNNKKELKRWVQKEWYGEGVNESLQSASVERTQTMRGQNVK